MVLDYLGLEQSIPEVHRFDTAKEAAWIIESRTLHPDAWSWAEVAQNYDRKVEISRIVELCRALHEQGVELRGCEKTCALLSGATAATAEDWGAEYLAPILAVKIVDGVDAAMAHISRYGSQHTDTIVTENHTLAMRFLREVDSGSVMVNASTRFADGFEYGLGAEIGVSTDKLHARGPVGLEGLTSEKYIVLGNGHIRQ